MQNAKLGFGILTWNAHFHILYFQKPMEICIKAIRARHYEFIILVSILEESVDKN